MKRDNSSTGPSPADPAQSAPHLAEGGGPLRSALRATVRVDRALTELRRGRPVRLTGGDAGELIVAAVETLSPVWWQALDTPAVPDLDKQAASAPDAPRTLAEKVESVAGPGLDPLSFASDPVDIRLVLSAERAQALGWPRNAVRVLPANVVSVSLYQGSAAPGVPPAPPPGTAVVVRLPAGFDVDRLAALAGLAPDSGLEPGAGSAALQSLDPDRIGAAGGPAAASWAAALEMARLARLVPAIVVVPAPVQGGGDDALLAVDVADLDAFPHDRAMTLMRVSEAPVPLAGHEDSRFVLFREAAADVEHVAIVVGDPDPTAPVMVRLHSSCLTGDLFGSLRCDCGDQLRGAIDRLGEAGGGVLLYLAQEGRGIGLANKLRAYTHQDTGADTIDADRYLGFRGDERRFDVAVQMLRSLGITQVRLLTNNPGKIDALRAAGLDVVERLPIGGLVNRHNERYLATKRDRAGHLIDVSIPAVPARQAR